MGLNNAAREFLFSSMMIYSAEVKYDSERADAIDADSSTSNVSVLMEQLGARLAMFTEAEVQVGTSTGLTEPHCFASHTSIVLAGRPRAILQYAAASCW